MGHSAWRLTPKQSIEAECARRGRCAVNAGCARLIDGDDTDAGLIMVLGGPAAAKFFDGHMHDDVYWLRVWGTRGLLWAWDGSRPAAVATALGDEAWRVRELAVKVVARHRLDEHLATVAQLRADPVPRVAAAAHRAVTVLAR